MPIRRLSRLPVVLSLVLALFLTGCVHIELESAFDSDGSALHAFKTTMEREGIEQLGSFGGDDGELTFDPNEGREEAEAAGFTFESIDNDDEVGSRISKRYEDGEQVGVAFDEMFASSTDEGVDPPLGAVSGTFVKDGDEYRLNLTIDSDILFADTPASGEEAEEFEGFGLGSLDSFFEITYTATMPGEIKETNGTDLGDGKVEWELPLTGLTEITAVSSEGSSGGIGGLLIIGGLVALLAAGGLAGVFLFTRRRTPVTVSNTGSFNPAPTAAPSGSYGANPPSWSEPDATPERPSSEQDTNRLPE